MTAAARAALALDRRLRGAGPGMARRFQRDLARVNARFWMLATSEDFRHPRTSGEGRGRRVRLVHWYMDRVLRLAPSNRVVCLRLAAVANMVSPPTVLLTPPVLRALLFHCLTVALHDRADSGGVTALARGPDVLELCATLLAVRRHLVAL